jgi:hypothetical protein
MPFWPFSFIARTALRAGNSSIPGIFLFFAQKTRGLGHQRKFLSIKAKDGPGRALKNVLTAKTGVFGGRLAEKRRGRSKKMTFLRVFPVFWDFSPRKRLKPGRFRRFDPSKQNRA